MSNPKSASLAFFVLVWTIFLILVGLRAYDYISGPEGFGGIRIKPTDEMLNGSP